MGWGVLGYRITTVTTNMKGLDLSAAAVLVGAFARVWPRLYISYKRCSRFEWVSLGLDYFGWGFLLHLGDKRSYLGAFMSV